MASSGSVHLPTPCTKTMFVLLLTLGVFSPKSPLPFANAFFGEWGPDLEGPWCATRPRGEDCCTGRNDDCSVPILGTLCYCDIFCNDTAYDCCPDYWPHCHGFRYPTTTPRPTTLPTPRLPDPCVADGRQYGPGEKTYDNCNTCTCELKTVPYRRYDWSCTDFACLIRPEIIRDVNDGPYTWQASNYSQLWGLTLDDGVKYRLGTFLLPEDVVLMTPIRVQDDVLPESFDARQKWPNFLHPISDQSNCGSSWAHSTTAVASDRLAIETEGEINEILSVQHLISCNTEEQLGCEGGNLDRAWWFLRKYGVVTEECYPYTSGQTDQAGQCLISPLKKGGACPSGIQYKVDKRYQATPPYRIRPDEREIMKEILDNGPVQAIFQVREDFFMYKRGIYSYTQVPIKRGDPPNYLKSGFHSVRILGWGAERTPEGDIVKYWIGANSWGPNWGENGYFRILRGTDESRIERYVIGVWGKIEGDPVLQDLLTENRRRRLRAQRRRRHMTHNLRSRERRRRSRRRQLRMLRTRDGFRRRNNHLNDPAAKLTKAQRRRNRRLRKLKNKSKKNKKSKESKGSSISWE